MHLKNYHQEKLSKMLSQLLHDPHSLGQVGRSVKRLFTGLEPGLNLGHFIKNLGDFIKVSSKLPWELAGLLICSPNPEVNASGSS